MDVLRGALTNLGKYNEGGLDYVWVSFPCDEDDFQDSLKKIGIGEDRGDGSVYEEWFFSDWDTDYDWVDLSNLGEYEDFDDVNEYAEALENIVDEDQEEEFRAAMEYSGDFHDAVDLVETGSVTKISDESMSNRMDEAIGAYYMDSMGFSGLSNVENYFDYEAYGRDIRIEYYPMDDGDPETAEEYWCGDERASDEEIGRAVVKQLGWDGVGKDAQKRYFDYDAFGHDIQIDLTFVQTDDGIFEIR